MYGLYFVAFLLFFSCEIQCKYIEGVLKTSENWAFLTRFCFLSEEGQFEYQIEFNEDQGDPNLLLYYDTDSQWPAVYKTNKSCEEKESVLNVKQNQIVNLTTRLQFYKDHSGCRFLHSLSTAATYTLIVPTLKPAYKSIKGIVTMSPTISITESDTTSSIDWNIVPSSTLDYPMESTLYTDVIITPRSQEQGEFTTEEYFSSTVDDIYVTQTPTTVTIPITSKKRSFVKKKRYAPSIPYNDIFLRKGRTVSCHNARRFRSSRERWWFIAVSNCNGTKGIDIRYRILMTNGPPGDYWHEHFSADEFYILPILMAFTIAYSFLLLGIIVCTIELKSRQLLHTSYKIFVFSIIVQLFGIIFVSSCYLKLALSGFMATKMRRFGLMLMGTSETSFVLLLLLLAKGFTVTRGRLPLPASIKLTVFMCLYTVTYLSIFIYEAQGFDPGEVLYLYESPAGYALISLRMISWCMFIYSTVFTLKHFPEKGNFYYPFNVFGTVWFIAGPVFILSANTYIDKWVRESVVFAVLLFISFGGHLMFLLLTMPSAANKNFPYHVRTTQIGIMELVGRAGTSTMEQFGHHTYEPTASVREQTVIIPLTRRTEEMFETMYQQVDRRRLSDIDDAADKRMNNVLSWSLAKNVQALELPADRSIYHSNSATASAHSRSDSSEVLSRDASFREVEIPKKTTPNIEEYIRDVPIELFTVSKMIVTTNTTTHTKPE